MDNKSFNQRGKSFGSVNQRPSNVNQRPSGFNQRPANNQYQTPPPTQPNNVVMAKTIGNTPAPQAAPQAAKTAPPVSQNTSANDAAMGSFISAMKTMVGSFAYISDEVITTNTKLAQGEGMTIDDRKIPFECAQYIMSNFGFICMGLVFDASFKESFVHAVTAEQNIDALPEEEKKQIRAGMTDPNSYQSDGFIILGMTTFTPAIDKQLQADMMSSFDKLEPYAKEFDEAVYALDDQAKLENGFIFSNWMYLIRAFTHNDMFMSYVITVIEKVKETIGVK